MLDKAFVQTGVDGSWVECLDDHLAHEGLERLNCALFIACDDDRDQHWFKFYRYHENDVVDFNVRTEAENQEVFAWAREQVDIVGFGHSFIRQYDWWKPQIVPMRWRIFQSTPSAPVFLAVDVAHVQQDRYGARFYYETFSINVAMERGVSVISHTGYGNERGVWTEQTDVDLPANISAIVVEALRDNTKAWCGIRPTITWPLQGKEAVFAYIAHPFDWNVTALRHFIGKDYAKLFPREQKDNFHPLCAYLAIHPTHSLRRAYAKNPYAIIWHVLLRGYGVEDLNLIQKFYQFDQSIAGIPFADAKLWKGKVIISRKNVARIAWSSVEYYLRWLEAHKSQRAMVNELYRFAKKGINQETSDTLSQLERYETALPKSVRRMLLRRGLTREVHDLISEAVLELQPDMHNYILLYKTEDYALEYQIGDYAFRLARQTHDLTVIGRRMNNCVASYRDKAMAGESIIMTATRAGNYVICLELDVEHHLHQAYGPYNLRLSGDDLLACGKIMPRDINRALAWLKHPVEEGHIPARLLCQKIQCDQARMHGTYADIIREGLRLAKLRVEMKQRLRTA